MGKPGGPYETKSVRLPTAAWAALEADAERCSRSMTGQIAAILKAYYEIASVELDEMATVRRRVSPDLAAALDAATAARSVEAIERNILSVLRKSDSGTQQRAALGSTGDGKQGEPSSAAERDFQDVDKDSKQRAEKRRNGTE